jgi:nucleotide-binding universal stress UspA family protein
MSEPVIVVALDTSELSEGAVPYAVSLAKATGSRLSFVTVWEGAERALIGSLPDVAQDLFQKGEQHYEQYLQGVAKRVREQGVDTEAEVRIGEPDEEILRLVQEKDARMLALASHGRSGISRWWYGSVAAKLARDATVPTLMLGPKALETGPGAGSIRRVLVPLDGSDLAELALPVAGELASALGAELHLAQALRWASQAVVYGVPEVNIVQIDQELMKASEEYLARTAQEMPKGVQLHSHAVRGMTADALIDLVAELDIDLVVMVSHTRSGLARAALGSVADRMLQSIAPVLLVRPDEGA